MGDLVGPGPVGLDRRRRADSQRAGWDDDVIEHDCVGGDDGTGADDAAVQHHGGISDHRPVLDGAALEVRQVADDAVVTDDGRVLGRGVQDGAVLHTRARADVDLSVVTAQHRGGPDGALGADGHRADDHGVGVDERARIDVGHLVTEGIHRHGHDRNAVPWLGMPVRIEIELTSSNPDGSWTWRAAGAREPRGVLDGSILPGTAGVGDQLRVETEKDVDGIRILSVVPNKEKSGRTDLLELLPTEESFEPVVQQRAPGGGGGGGRNDRGQRRPRRDRPDRGDRGDRAGRPDGDRRDGGRDDRDRRGPADRNGRGDRRDQPDRARRTDRGDRPDEERRRHRPHFTPPPEVPQRPKPKRLRPGKQHRMDVLASLPEEQRPVAELAQQGMPAVRQRLREDNARLRAEGKPPMPEAGVLKMAEELIPRLRVADWLDRAEAAQRQLAHLDLRDLRSVVASADDPVVARDESTRVLAVELKQALVTKQEEEQALWLADVEAALDVGRIVRALRLSSVPPKAGVPFPPSLAHRLGESTTAALQPTDGPDRWAAVLEAAAFSPVRALVVPTAPVEQRSDELMATVRRLAPLLPQVAAIYEIEVPQGAPMPKPLRPTNRRPEPKKAGPRPEHRDRPDRAAPPAAQRTGQRAERSEPEAATAPAEPEPTVAEMPAEPEVPAEVEPPAEVEEPAKVEAPVESEPTEVEVPVESEPAAVEVPVESEPAAVEVSVESEPAAVEVPVESEPAAVEVPVESEPAAVEVPVESEPAAVEVPAELEASAAAPDLSGEVSDRGA